MTTPLPEPALTNTAKQLKTAKGTKDWVGQELLLRDKIL